MTSNLAMYDIIREPLVTEKTSGDESKLAFKVRKDATKPAIKKAIEALFNVKVKSVNIINVVGKTKRFRGRKGFRPGYKKAIITLPAGSSLDVTTGV